MISNDVLAFESVLLSIERGKKMKIGISMDMVEAGNFIRWLNKRGYNARVICSEVCFINGVNTATDDGAGILLNRLWDLYASEDAFLQAEIQKEEVEA